ncbi:Fe-S cluster assembly scaffold SufA [Niveispirillum lacus]|uniref:Fe-S cluster assembly scaffold SufA n=1 Tax=Niveispirillum lacus TaxID=1981099 RepID=A0A255Z2U4_9PROT|nr:iron-sulfur cluster assembly accessory protein [Niveispirillum lacus]OYQ35798.1 Fe-S cluster assembly scaffold SufA [Niveispirillum lacus]
MARALPKALTLTDAAAERVRELMARSEKPLIGLRVGVKTRGCSGMSYFVEYAEEKKKFEEVVEDKGVTILIDPAATMFLIGSEMDYAEDKFQSGFTFKNPNEKARCGCGESFSV